MNLLSYPFRLAADGTVATVQDDTDAATTEGVAVLLLTRKGERDMAPDFGMSDPTFSTLDLAELNLGLIDYGPDVEVADLETTYPDDTTARLVVTLEETP